MNFDEFAVMSKRENRFVAVCRHRTGKEGLFKIVFQNYADLELFMQEHDDDVRQQSFYAQWYVDGKLFGENT